MRVPRRTDNGVAQQGLPNARVDSSAPLEAFGGGAAAAGPAQAANQLLDQADKIREGERQRADEAWSMEYAANLQTAKNNLMIGENGAAKRRKKDAFGVVPEYTGQFEKIADSYQGKEPTATQALLAKKIRLQIGTQLKEDLQRHAFAETRSYEEDTVKSFVAGQQDSAALNWQIPGRVEDSIKKQQAALASHAAKNGYGQEEAMLVISDATSKTHKSVIDSMLSGGKDLDAKNYFEKNKGAITRAEDITAVQKNLQEGSYRGEAQRNADTFWAQSKGSMKDALAMTKGLDPKVRELTEDRIRRMNSDFEAAKKQGQDSAWETGVSLLNGKTGAAARSSIPPHIFNAMSPEQQDKILKRNGDGPNNKDVWLDFLAKDQKTVAAMSRADFESQVWVNLDKEHKAKAETQWNAARDAKTNPKADAQFKSIKSDKEMILDSLRSTGVSGFTNKDTFETTQKDENKAKLYQEAEDASEAAFERHFQQTGKNPTDLEKKQIIGGILRKHVFVKRSFLGLDSLAGDKQVPAGLLTEDDKGEAYIPLDKIPAHEQLAIKNILKSKGKTATEDRIQRAYAAYVLGDRALYLKILGEK